MEKFKNIVGRIELYGDIEETPILNWIEHCNYFNMHCIGSTEPSEVQKHIREISLMVQDDSKDKAIEKLNNLQAVYFMALRGISPLALSYACLVRKIDGIEVKNSFSNKDLNDTIIKVHETGMTVKQLKKHLGMIKKKIQNPIEMFFTETSMKPDLTQITAQKRIAMNIISFIKSLDSLEDFDQKERMSNHDWFGQLNIPRLWGDKHVLVNSKKNFYQICDRLGKDPKNMTIFTFLTALEAERAKIKAMEKKNKIRI